MFKILSGEKYTILIKKLELANMKIDGYIKLNMQSDDIIESLRVERNGLSKENSKLTLDNLKLDLLNFENDKKIQNLESVNELLNQTKLNQIDAIAELKSRNEKLSKQIFILEQYNGNKFFTNEDGNLKFYDLVQVSLTPCYDCQWEFTVEKENKKTFFNLTLVDDYNESPMKVIKLLQKCKTMEDICELDEKDSIRYD